MKCIIWGTGHSVERIHKQIVTTKILTLVVRNPIDEISNHIGFYFLDLFSFFEMGNVIEIPTPHNRGSYFSLMPADIHLCQ